MKKYLLTIAILINGLITLAQTPTSFQYQAVLRDVSGEVLANQQVEIGIAILQGSASGAEMFSETHSVTTNNFGLANLQIGLVNPADMEMINWSAGPYFIQVSVDGTVMGTSQILSVPFALHALTVENDAVDDADADSTNEIQDISLSGNELSITNGSTVILPDAVNDADADPTNELQVLTLKGDTIFLTNGGYALLPAETDPLFLAWDKSTGVTIFESQITDLQHFTNADETDPVFESSLAKQIMESDTTRWGMDADPINELQFLSIKGDTIFLTNGGYVKLPAVFDGDFTSLTNIPPNLDTDVTDDFDGHYSSLSGAPQNVGEFANDAGYITKPEDADADPSNEIQVLSIRGDTIFLSGGGYAKLPVETDPLFSAWDKSTGVVISESQITDLQHFTNADETDPVFESSLAKQITATDTARWGKDAGPTNELQDINLDGTDLSITNGSTVDLSVLQDGTGTDKQLLGWQVNNQGDIKLHISNGNSVTLPFIREEVDGDPSNELNTSVVLNGTDLEVTDAGGTITTDLSSLIDDADTNPTNELNTNVVLNGTELEITDAGGTITTDLSSLIDADADSTNEIQNLADVLDEGNDGGAGRIKNIADPTDTQDAVTLAYMWRTLLKLMGAQELVDAGFTLEQLFDFGLGVGALEQDSISETALTNANLIGTVSDVDGNDYKWVKIGTQFWMAENLKTTKYNDGSEIPLVTNNYSWSNLSTPAYCWYDNNSANYAQTYGALYNWYAVNTGEICPQGWHVPTNDEWTTLVDYLGGRGSAGGKLKETGTTHWESPNTGATNESGFTDLPGGYRDKSRGFLSVGKYSGYWSSTAADAEEARGITCRYDRSFMNLGSNYKESGISIRCVKD